MADVTKTVQRFLHMSRDYDGKAVWDFYGCDMSEHGYICIKEIDLSFTVPQEGELIRLELAHLKEKEQKLRAKCEVECNHIKDKISNLLLLQDKRGERVDTKKTVETFVNEYRDPTNTEDAIPF